MEPGAIVVKPFARDVLMTISYAGRRQVQVHDKVGSGRISGASPYLPGSN